MKIDNDDVMLTNLTIEQKINENKLDDAVKEFKRLKELAPNNRLTAEAANRIGNSYGYSIGYNVEEEGDTVIDDDLPNVMKAIDFYNEAIKIDPTFLEAYIGLGDSYSDLRKFEEALDQFKKVLKSNPKPELEAKCLMSIGKMYENQRKYDDALTEFNKILELDVDNTVRSEALDAAGHIYVLKGDNNQALNKFSEAKEFDNTLEEAPLQLASEIYTYKSEDDGIDQYKKIIESDPNSELAAKAYIGIGDIYSDKEDFIEAENNYREAIKISPTSKLAATALNSIGDNYYSQKNKDATIENYKAALKIDPNFEIAIYNLAATLELKNMHKEALLEINKAIQINPKNSDYYNLKGNIFWRRQYQEAVEAYKKAIEIDPTSYWPYDNLARLYEIKKQKEKAIETWINCLKIAHLDEEGRDKTGKIKTHLKKLDMTEKDIEIKIKSLEPILNDRIPIDTESIQEIVNKYKQYEKTHEKEMRERQEYHKKYKKFLSVDTLRTITKEDFEKNFLHQFLQYNGRITLTGSWRNDIEKNSELIKESLIKLFSRLEVNNPIGEAVDDFLSKMPVKSELFITAILSDFNIGRYIPFSKKVIERMQRLNLYPSDRIDKNATFGQKYEICNKVLNDFGKKYDLTLESLDHFLWWVEDSNINLSANNKKILEPQQNAADLSKKTFLSLDFLENIKELLDDKRQLIFYGVPGTGKTFVAKEFGKYFTNCASEVDLKNQFKLIQFHQSYSYEEFMEGIRPEPLEDNKGMSYPIKSGIFKTFCDEAGKNRDKKYLLIIDEINRGNISKIFGELLFLLEYRDNEITLPYSKKLFSIPDNVYIIGTMNTADRSIAFVDYALRRRFYFVEFLPNKEVLKKWLNENPDKMSYIDVLNLFNKLNDTIKNDLDEHHQIGHSYFMIKKGILDEKRLKLIWEYNIMPLLNEYFFTKTNLDDYRFDSMIKS